MIELVFKCYMQGFPNSFKGWRGFLQWGKAFSYWVVRTWGGVILTFEPFSKLKTLFCKCWTNEVKIKMVQEQWLQLKMKFLLVITRKLLFRKVVFNLWWRPIRIWWGECLLGGISPGGKMSKFSASRGTPLHPPCTKNPEIR